MPWLAAGQAEPFSAAPPPAPPAPPPSPAPPGNNESAAMKEMIQILSERNLKFAFKIYKMMLVDRLVYPDFVLSPFSISIALIITAFGARNYTLKQLNDALELNGINDHMKIAKAYEYILKTLDLKGDITLAISNRILIDKTFSIKKPFLDMVTNELRAVATNVNFLGDGQTLNAEIIKGLDQLAREKLKNLPSLGNGQNSLGAVVVSAIYFKGKWAQQFRKECTKSEEFIVNNNCKHAVQMMNTVGEYFYAEDQACDSKILQVEFDGNRLTTYFVLPNQVEGIRGLKDLINYEWFNKMKNSLRQQTVAVKLPKFNCNFMKELSPELYNLKIHDVLSEIYVDLKEMAEPSVTGKSLFVQKILYGAYVEMVEEGAEAVGKPVPNAAQGAAGPNTSPPRKPVEFFANHPFLFIIYDKSTNFILFMGNVICPFYS